MKTFSFGDCRCEWILDTHLHLHPHYDIGKVLRDLAGRCAALRSRAPAAVLGGIFAEMEGGYSWNQLCAGAVPGLDELEVISVDEGAIAVQVNDTTIHLFRGKQVVTREGIEVLALLAKGDVASGGELRATIDTIVELHGIPVLPWSPGKWWGKRGRMVREIVAHDPRVWVGDISLRWWGKWQPIALKRLGDASARILYGSDPLPIAGGEVVTGELLTGLWAIEGEETSEAREDNEPRATISEQLRRALTGRGTLSRSQGSYQRPLGAISRWVRIILRKIVARVSG